MADPKWGSGPGAVEFLESEVCFDAPFTHTLCFVVRVENKVHIINIVWQLQLKCMRVIYSQNLQIQPPPQILNGGTHPECRCWIPLCLRINWSIYLHIYILNQLHVYVHITKADGRLVHQSPPPPPPQVHVPSISQCQITMKFAPYVVRNCCAHHTPVAVLKPLARQWSSTWFCSLFHFC